MPERNRVIIGFSTFECRGAKPDSQLAQPVTVTVDCSQDGERQIGCPYMQGAKYGQGSFEQTTYHCQAISSGFRSLDLWLNLQELPKDGAVKKFITGEFPLCVHKYPS